MKKHLKFLVIVVFLNGCAEIPPETMELSDTVGRDLGTLEEANLALVDTLFERMERDVDQFIDTQYRPAYVRKLVEEFGLVDEINLALSEQPDAVLIVLEEFVSAAVEDVDNKRSELLEKIRQQHNGVRTEVERSFNQVRTAQSVIGAHLASVMKVHDMQDDLLEKAGLEDARHKIASETAEVSRKISQLTDKGSDFEGTWDEKVAEMDKLIARIEEELK
ncbi:hypothetical protein AUP42_01725 [Thalassospira lucentensis]|uniref:Uncharacterized protein n=1 Tax=Thalassospira lucentensis TaxID=168935 RepID=A0A154L3V4_9PROT|nr:hypothetical protein [Thalassospira lucentensis]KZB63137.1 hypothetical protein AUP42_01725 [Thalassospira lucentensis]